MLNCLHVQNFTVFADATFEFSPGLNVIVGTNGTGKSHVLKLGYAAQVVYAGAPREVFNGGEWPRTLDPATQRLRDRIWAEIKSA